MVSLLVRNYSIHFHCCCCYFFFCCCSFCCFCFYWFQSLAHFMSTNTKPSGTIGDTQKTMTISATSFRGCNRFSPLLMCIRSLCGIFMNRYRGYSTHPLTDMCFKTDRSQSVRLSHWYTLEWMQCSNGMKQWKHETIEPETQPLPAC